MAVSIVIFIIAYVYKRQFAAIRSKLEYINTFFDAVGLAAFTLTGSEVAFTHGFSDNAFIVIFVGMITGVGGGIIRDIIIHTTPYVFKKHVYALASILGSLVYFLLKINLDNSPIVSVVPMVLVVVVRMLAARYRWSLPRVDTSRNKER